MKRYHYQRTGAIIPLLAVVMTVLLAIAALTINGSWLMYNKINAQNTADLSARSALVKITSDSVLAGRIDRARELAIRMYELNIDREGASIDPDKIRFGVWQVRPGQAPVFRERFRDGQSISSVHVDQPTAAEDRNVKVYLSEFLGGRDTLDIVAEAVSSTRPIDLILCLDASRSMNKYPIIPPGEGQFPPGSNLNTKPIEGSRWFELTETVRQFINAMKEVNPNARIGLVTFGGGASEALIRSTGKGVLSPLDAEFARKHEPLTLVTSPKIEAVPDTLEGFVDLPTLGLGTSIFDGLKLSVESFDDEDSSKHIVLLSDGAQAGVDRDNPRVAAAMAADANIKVHTISFAQNVQSLEDIAEDADGEFFPAADAEELKEAFARLLARFRTQLVD